MIFGSERSSDAMRARIKELLDLDDMFDITGMTELYGPGTGLDCHRHEGIHYWADYYILECLDPESLEPVPPGEVGEMVITTLCKEAAPLIRYRTRDLTRMIDHPCSCGSVLPMHDRILGRSDDMIIFRAVNIYPGQIDEVLSPIAEPFGWNAATATTRPTNPDSLQLCRRRLKRKSWSAAMWILSITAPCRGQKGNRNGFLTTDRSKRKNERAKTRKAKRIFLY